MALPTSGQLSINDIRNELGSTSGSLVNLSQLAGFSPPFRISDFYGYSPATSAVDLAGRITGTRLSSRDFQFNFLIDYASGDYSGFTQLYVDLTYFAYDYDTGTGGSLDTWFIVDITDFEASSSTFRAPLNGPSNKYFYGIANINYWETDSSETLNIINLTT